tara:strand:- start:59 stop:274 length:216 start_codon:yes stop_codon:yes gene_type:complete
MMKKLLISLRDLPDNERYILISKSMGGDNQRAAIYKRYLSIFYVRVSPVYKGGECLTIAVKEYELLIKLTK